MAGRTGKKANIVFSKPHEPSFLKKFKEKVGYKEQSGIAEKFQVMPKATDDDLEDGDDELPQVVQLNPGDISQDEYSAMIADDESSKDVKQKDEISDGVKILFRHGGSKRSRDQRNELKASTKKQKLQEEAEGENKEGREEKSEKKEKSNKKLLSFDDEEEDST